MCCYSMNSECESSLNQQQRQQLTNVHTMFNESAKFTSPSSQRPMIIEYYNSYKQINKKNVIKQPVEWCYWTPFWIELSWLSDCVCVYLWIFGKFNQFSAPNYNCYFFVVHFSSIWLPFVYVRYIYVCLFVCFFLLLFFHINRYTDWHKWYKNNTVDSRYRHNGPML